MTEHHTPEAGSDSGANQSSGLERELLDTSAETQRAATHLLADTLSNTLSERRAVQLRALGPEAYNEAMKYLRASTHASADVDHAYDEIPGIEELGRSLREQPQNPTAHEMPGAPDSVNDLENVESWLASEIGAALDPYDLMRGQLYSHPTRFDDHGQEQITISRFVPDTDAGVVYEVTASGAPGNLRELRKSLLTSDARSGARQLTPGEAVDLETALNRYHARMTEIAALEPAEIMALANSRGDGPEAEPA